MPGLFGNFYFYFFFVLVSAPSFDYWLSRGTNQRVVRLLLLLLLLLIVYGGGFFFFFFCNRYRPLALVTGSSHCKSTVSTACLRRSQPRCVVSRIEDDTWSLDVASKQPIGNTSTRRTLQFHRGRRTVGRKEGGKEGGGGAPSVRLSFREDVYKVVGLDCYCVAGNSTKNKKKNKKQKKMKGGDSLTVDVFIFLSSKCVFSHSLAEWKKSGCNISGLSDFTDCLKCDTLSGTTCSQQPGKRTHCCCCCSRCCSMADFMKDRWIDAHKSSR